MNRWKEASVVFSLSILFLTLSIYPTASFFFQTPPDSVYSFLHNSVSDYPYYISFIRQGVVGRTNTIDQFTSERQTPGMIHAFYLLLGKAGGQFHFSPIVIYFLARIVFGFLFLTVAYWFLSLFFSSSLKRILAFFLFISSAGFPKVVVNGNIFQVWQYLFWWTEIDPFRRASFIPHVLAGHIGLISILGCFITYFRTKRLIFFIGAILTGLITGMVHPPSLGMVYYIILSYLLIIGISKLNFRLLFQTLVFFIFFVVLTIPSLLYIYKTTASVFPWTLMGIQESRFYAIDIVEYVLALGPLFAFGVIGAVGVLIAKKDNRSIWWYVPLLWVVIDIVMIPLSRILAFYPLPVRIPTFANIRFLSMAIQLPLAVLAVYFFSLLQKRFGYFLMLFPLGVYAVLTALMYPGSIAVQLHDFSSVRSYLYPSRDLVSAFQFLDAQKDKDAAVFLNPKNSLLLPLFASNRIFYGQAIYTSGNDQKKQFAKQFFGGEAKACDVYQYFKDGNIKYVLDENEMTAYPQYRSFLSQMYTYNSVSVFEFQTNDQINQECMRDSNTISRL